MLWCVYMHINKINHKVYIGVAKGKPEKRWGKNGSKYSGTQQVFANAIKKYGWNNFDHKILATNLTQREAWDMEIKLISQYKSNCKRYNNPSFGYNMTDGGEGSSGFTHTEATKAKMKENIIAIRDYLTNLVKDYDETIDLKYEFCDRTDHSMTICVEKKKSGDVRVYGRTGGLSCTFYEGEESYGNKYAWDAFEYPFEILERWNRIKAHFRDELENAKSTRKNILNFKV